MEIEISNINVYDRKGNYLGKFISEETDKIKIYVDEENHIEVEKENCKVFDNDTFKEYNKEYLENIQSKENFPRAVLAGAVTAILCILLWAFITYVTNYQIGYMATAVGYLIGFVTNITGQGVSKKFQIFSGALSILSCLIGNLAVVFIQLYFRSNFSYEYILDIFDFTFLISTYIETIQFVDFLFYAIAFYAGYKYSIANLENYTELTLIEFILNKYNTLK
jgi:hypothetical protein